MDKKTRGAWIVHHARKLQSFHTPGEFSAIRVAGKAGMLLSALSADDEGTLTTPAVESLGVACGIDPRFELPVILDALKARSLIDRVATGGVAVLGITSSAILEHTSDVFDGEASTPSENASLTLAELCSVAPTARADANKLVAETHQLQSMAARSAVERALQVNFVDSEVLDSSRTLLFNGNLFRRASPAKVQIVLDSLSPADKAAATGLDQTLSQTGCVEYSAAIRLLNGEALFKKLVSIGLYDVSVVANSSEERSYVTKPAAFAKFAPGAIVDAFDNAKALVAALTYGMERSASGRGRIDYLGALLSKLIAGQEIGAATAIGEDYQVLETRGVVRLRHYYGGRYFMRLLKREVGEMAKLVLTEGDAASATVLPPQARVSVFKGPEVQREATRKQPLAPDDKEVARLLENIRMGRP